jgi:GTP-binding protein EngB required for normal cell division
MLNLAAVRSLLSKRTQLRCAGTKTNVSLLPETSEKKSNRQLFREIVPNKSVLDHLDALNLGYCATRRMRVKVARKWEGRVASSSEGDFSRSGGRLQKRSVRAVTTENDENAPTKPRLSPDLTSRPFPFNFLGRPIQRISRWEELSYQVKSGPPEVAVIGRSNAGKSTLVNTLLGYDQSFVQRTVVSDKPGETMHLHFYGIGRGPQDAAGFPCHANIINGKNEKRNSDVDDAETEAKEHTINYNVSSSSNNNSKSKSSRSSCEAATPVIKAKKRPPAIVLVDMPGYGFASMSKEDKARCDELSSAYLRNRGATLKRYYIVVCFIQAWLHLFFIFSYPTTLIIVFCCYLLPSCVCMCACAGV